MSLTIQRRRFPGTEDAFRTEALLQFMWKAATLFSEDRGNETLRELRAAADEEAAREAFALFHEALEHCLCDGSLQKALQDYATYREVTIAPGGAASVPDRVVAALQDADLWFWDEIREAGGSFHGLSHDAIYENLLPNTPRFANMILRAVDENLWQPKARHVMLKLQ